MPAVVVTFRPLGTSGLSISSLVLGGNVFGWTVDEKRSFELLDAWVDYGFTSVDTADVYSVWKEGNRGGESETVIGRWLKRSGRRGSVQVFTKVGWSMGEGRQGLARQRILKAAEDSLSRLQTDYIDLYQSHLDDPQVPVEEPLSAYARLVEQGKVRAIGASNFTSERLTAALDASTKHGLPAYVSLQPLYNLYDRDGYEGALEGVCTRHGLGVIPYSSLRSGFLSGKYRSEADLSKSVRGKRVKDFLNPRGFRILEALDTVASRAGTSQTAVALAWLLARPSVTAPIVSATSLAQMAELVAGAALTLEPDQLTLLDGASRPEESRVAAG
jgi:aryl-alcohol dehydrogenase-like predicted oxidoreductase